ncbi:lysozyme inhibitor LprI family protein [Dyella sp.]|uniref:lysozyme inhibitor LprI family protein n=1 Tax=Dyella sp. TaxID=1869338 RepID=UPI002FDB232E
MQNASRLLLVWLVFLCTLVPCRASDLPSALLGRWQVVEVHTNDNVTFKTHYVWNDARLRWRIFNFSNTRLSDDTSDSGACEAPMATVTSMPLRKLMDDSLAHPDGDDADSHPTPEAYDLKASPNEQVEVMSIHCKDRLWQGDLGTGKGMMGAWMYLTHTGQLVVRWRDETLLVLDRLPADARPQASFDCAKASSAAEKTICSSLQLASFDRSVNWSYKVARDGIKDTDYSPAQLADSQRAWLHKRDACGANAPCLLTAMKQRLEELASYP